MTTTTTALAGDRTQSPVWGLARRVAEKRGLGPQWELMEADALTRAARGEDWTTPDVPRLRMVLDYAAAEKERAAKRKKKSRFDMNMWFDGTVVKTEDSPPPMACGTAACLAGTASAFYAPVGSTINVRGVWVGRKPDFGMADQSIESFGRGALGLCRTQADVLFMLTRSKLPEIRVVASAIAGEDLTLPGDIDFVELLVSR